jgi:hypothetical protein
VWATWGLVGLGLAAVAAIGPHGWKARAGDTTRLVSPFGDDQSGGNDCTSPDLPCKTIQNAVNHSDSGDLIELAPGTYTESVTVNQSVTIQGDFINSSTVNGNNAGPVFIIDAVDTFSAPLTATLSMLTITNGTSGESGGGVSNAGTLTVVQSTISGNTASAGGGGGGISNNGGTVTIINSTISGNTAGVGGGILNTTPGTVTLVNSTINANTAIAGAGSGGGIFNGQSATLNFTNTIIAGSPSGGDCVNNGTIGTNDHNLVQDGSCSPAGTGNPKLGPLQNNGGPTFTHALLTGSPAIDAGDDAVLNFPFNLSTDQRGEGFPRKACAHVDIGAYEFAAGTAPVVTCPANRIVFTDPGQTTATLSFTVTATDLCAGTLTPTCKIGPTVITSPFAFPVGTTTVTCSATNPQGLTGMCSFSVNVSLLNGCIQDDFTHDIFRFNTQTGAYVYIRCRDKFTLTGTGMVRIIGNIVTLTDNRTDRRISASLNTSQMTGRANITLIPAPGVFQTIVVNQTNPHATCVCP